MPDQEYDDTDWWLDGPSVTDDQGDCKEQDNIEVEEGEQDTSRQIGSSGS